MTTKPIIPIIYNSNFISMMIDGESVTVNSDHPNFGKVREQYKKDPRDGDALMELINVPKYVAKTTGGRVEIKDDAVLYDGKVVHNFLATRMIEMLRDGFDITPLMNFLENLMNNPSKTAIDELYKFLEHAKIPVTEDGCFLAYKKVRGDFKDIYTGTMDNSPGQILEMPRNSVDDRRDNTCSTGLHFAALSYMPHYGAGSGNKIVIVKVNPKDVVSIPSDYNNAKGRACRYEVVGEHAGGVNVNAFSSLVYSANVTDGYKPVITQKSQSDWDRGRKWGRVHGTEDRNNGENPRDMPTDGTDDYIDAYKDSYWAAYRGGVENDLESDFD